ncbi:MAG: DUF2490 domain-containing protein [Kiritimatiellae bacterium]|nr:DUF2490 domain-containing protein [Kiritimatiellia bacterium]MDD4736171.1 DUF2490 domain-containing protein [Kiritimatiellia bacterium]
MSGMKRGWLALLLVAGALQSALAYQDGDSQLWMKFGASGNMDCGVKVSVAEELRLGDDMKEYYYAETALSASYDVQPWLNLGLTYVEVFERKEKVIYDSKGNEINDHYFRPEHMPRVEATVKHKVAGWGFDDRVRMEYRMKEDTQDYFRYRNRIRVKSPWKVTPLAINPYVAWELFLSDLPDDVNWVVDRHRFYAGVGMKLVKNLSGGLYYLKQLDWKSSDWLETNVLGIELSASF